MKLKNLIQNLKKLFEELSSSQYNIVVIDEEDGFVVISVKNRKMQLFFRIDESGNCYISSSSMQMIEGQLQTVPSSISLTAEQSARYNIYNGDF